MRPPVPALSRRAALAAGSLTGWRPTWNWALGVLRSFVTSFIALSVALWLLPGTQVTSGTLSVAGLAVVVLAVGALLRPFVITLTVLTGAVGLIIGGLVAQAAILALALALMPTVEPFSLTEVFLASWAATVVAAVVNWLFDTSTEEALLGQVMGRAVATASRHEVSGPGLVIVQLDGVSLPLLRQAFTSGATPHLARWVRSGSHSLREWDTGLPATTPAGQSVLMHGDTKSVPGFRWYDKARGRTFVCSSPADVAIIEQELSTGRGLLADGGVSVSNLFSGDASVSVMTMSDARLPSAQRGAASYMTARTGFARSFVLFLGQVLTELHQGRRQRLRNVVPRVHRGRSFVFLRGLTTVVLRDLNVSIVADQMARGVPAVFVDFVDYDEVAHHAGPSRPETMRTLESLDRIIGFLTSVAAEVGRDYEIAVVSDHGQSQGSTFHQLTGQTLSEVVNELIDTPGRTPEEAKSESAPKDNEPAEPWAPVGLLRQGASGVGRTWGRAADTAARRTPADHASSPAVTDPPSGPLVLSSGSLAHIYFPAESGRMTHEQIQELHPRLVTGLASTAHVGVVLTRDSDGECIVHGAEGWRVLSPDGATGGEGEDPLAPYGSSAAAGLLGLDRRDHVGDIVALGRFDPVLDEVAAFEDLVGSHGGLGGDQTRAMLLHPASWQVPTELLDGTAVHQAMVGRLEQMGLRR